MRIYKNSSVLGAVTLIALAFFDVSADSQQKNAECGEKRQFIFSWSFQDQCNMLPRGGTSKGAKVTLDPTPHPGWVSLQEEGLSDYERDRRAILAMAGPYRTSFDFLEVAGYTPDFKPDRPYQSWGTEYVYLVEDQGDFISLQHIMVMYFIQEDGGISEPMVMKHWRQDWKYEKRELFTYQGNNTWQKTKFNQKEIEGSWAQAVYQVDDSPRYEAYGKWEHKPNFSTWLSSTTWRPLPRREHSVRNDYQVLEGSSRHTIVPNGWIHEEQNYKRILKASNMTYLAKEFGVNRYERIINHDYSEGDQYWQTTALFWSNVRDGWAKLIKKHNTLSLKKSIDGVPLFMPLFEQASIIAKEGSYDSKTGRAKINSLLRRYIRQSE